MIYTEKVCDLFSVSEDYRLVQCASADFALGKGIALAFNTQFAVKERLKKAYPDYLIRWEQEQKQFDCIPVGRVYNLITKKRYFQKPTYDTMQGAFHLLKTDCQKEGVKKLAMPLLGCGLDGLQWDRVSEMIKETFQDMEIEILVCRFGIIFLK